MAAPLRKLPSPSQVNINCKFDAFDGGKSTYEFVTVNVQ